MTQKSTQAVVQKVLREHGIPNTPRVEEVQQVPHCASETNLRTEQMILQFDPSPAAQRFLQQKNVVEPLETCLRDIVGHECGHINNTQRPACPKTLEEH